MSVLGQDFDARVPEVVTHGQQRHAPLPGQCISEAVTEVEPGRMAAALAEIAVGIARDACLALGDVDDCEEQILLKRAPTLGEGARSRRSSRSPASYGQPRRMAV